MSDAEETESRTFGLAGMELTSTQIVMAILGLAVLLLVPEVEDLFVNVRLSTTHRGLLFGLAAVGLNLLLRHTGLVSFGHAAFFGGGAYGSAVLFQHLGVREGVLLFLGALVVATTLAVIIGWLVSGHVDIYFALLTLAFNQLLYALVLGLGFFNYSDGLFLREGTSRPTLFGLALGSDRYDLLLYYVTIVIVIVSLIVMWRIVKSPFGRALDAVGQDRTRAQFIGIPVKRYVWAAFVISGLYGGLAGGLFALIELHIQPGPTLFAFRSGEILFMAILGGFQTLTGPLVGGVVLVYFLENAQFITEFFNALTGAVLLVIVFVLPKGIVGSVPDIWRGLLARARNPNQLGEDASAIGTLITKNIKDAVETTRILLFGVK